MREHGAPRRLDDDGRHAPLRPRDERIARPARRWGRIEEDEALFDAAPEDRRDEDGDAARRAACRVTPRWTERGGTRRRGLREERAKLRDEEIRAYEIEHDDEGQHEAAEFHRQRRFMPLLDERDTWSAKRGPSRLVGAARRAEQRLDAAQLHHVATSRRSTAGGRSRTWTAAPSGSSPAAAASSRSWPDLCGAIAAGVRATTVVLDGEVACLHSDGRPDFNALFFRRSAPVFYAFDCISLDGRDLRARPLVERKRHLRRIVTRRADRVRYLDHVVGRGRDLFRAVCELDMEGVVAKRRDGVYTSDPAATTWWKVKNVGYSEARDRWELFEPRAAGGRR